MLHCRACEGDDFGDDDDGDHSVFTSIDPLLSSTQAELRLSKLHLDVSVYLSMFICARTPANHCSPEVMAATDELTAVTAPDWRFSQKAMELRQLQQNVH